MEANLREEIAQLHKEIPRRSVPPIACQAYPDDRTRAYFKGEKRDNPMEFLLHCEKEMEMVKSVLTDREKVDWIVRYMQDSAGHGII